MSYSEATLLTGTLADIASEIYDIGNKAIRVRDTIVYVATQLGWSIIWDERDTTKKIVLKQASGNKFYLRLEIYSDQYIRFGFYNTMNHIDDINSATVKIEYTPHEYGFIFMTFLNTTNTEWYAIGDSAGFYILPNDYGSFAIYLGDIDGANIADVSNCVFIDNFKSIMFNGTIQGSSASLTATPSINNTFTYPPTDGDVTSLFLYRQLLTSPGTYWYPSMFEKIAGVVPGLFAIPLNKNGFDTWFQSYYGYSLEPEDVIIYETFESRPIIYLRTGSSECQSAVIPWMWRMLDTAYDIDIGPYIIGRTSKKFRRVNGTVKVNDIPARRKVIAYDRSNGFPVGGTVSDNIDGSFSIRFRDGNLHGDKKVWITVPDAYDRYNAETYDMIKPVEETIEWVRESI